MKIFQWAFQLPAFAFIRATMEDDNDRSEYAMAVNPVGTIYMDMSGRNSHTTVQYLRPLSHTESQSTNHYQMIPFVGNREITLRSTTLESVPVALPERRQEVPVVYSTVGRKRVKKSESGCKSHFSLIFTVISLLIGLLALVIGIYLLLQKDNLTNVNESVGSLQSNVSNQRAEDIENSNDRFTQLENLLELSSTQQQNNVDELNTSIGAHGTTLEHVTERIAMNQNKTIAAIEILQDEVNNLTNYSAAAFAGLGEEIDKVKSKLPNISYQLIQGNVRMICGHALVIPIGETRSVNYYFSGGSYDDHEDCMFQLITTSSAKLRISFLEFQIEICGTCNICDYFAAYDGLSTNSNQLFLGCGYDLPPSLNTSSNIATLWFKTDHSVNMEGFNIQTTTFT